ncbi:hypothetical protein FORMB_17780 [Formosa sp. Hel1_33_131]|jgi:hypothetical protein|uniref:DUF6090 family protein n=1 Tax=Formosa sp. Hel1_33_131 TaxID=1336794 RepID=UPI00084E0F75|nr:DUF6090 family protein [Formosa sp. Hel1_33_131]AOR28812.1 hypothetical protein FORMB_17780 [Formosa sp. Hel1_33_131]
MTKILRKARQKLVSENKVSNYIIYAIGEIILLVIGILIALQINNINEKNKTEEREQEYLISIKNELTNNLKIIELEKKKLTLSLEGQRNLVRLINREFHLLDEKKLSHLLNQAFSNEIVLNYENGVFTELLNSGGIIDISSKKIKNKISSWDGIMTNVRREEQEFHSIRQAIKNCILEHGDIRTLMDDEGLSEWAKAITSKKNNSNKLLLKSQHFENLLIIYLVTGSTLHEEIYVELEKNIHVLLEMVEKDLR